MLVDDVWGDAAPTTAVRTLHSHVNRLRTVLGRDHPWALETVAGGYQMVLRREDLDAWVFEDLLSSSEEEGVEPTGVAERLREALQLWRGPAYGEFLGTGFADAESTRLEAMRELAIEDRVEADLAAGLGPGLVAELETLVAEHPFRERLWAALVVATYRSGRQAEALGVYQRARDLLLDELGVDPGPELRSAESRVLAQDPDLLASPPQAPVHCPWKGLAAYEPADSGFFVGRERLVSELVARLVDNSVVVVTGPSGSGKSSVVRAGLLPSLAARSRTWLRGSGGAPSSRRARTRWPVQRGLGRQPGPARDRPGRGAVPGPPKSCPRSQRSFAARSATGPGCSSSCAVISSRVLPSSLVCRRSPAPGRAGRRAGTGRAAAGGPGARPQGGSGGEPALVEAVVADVAGRPAALPLLSTALVRTWERCDGRRLTMADYVAAGGRHRPSNRWRRKRTGALMRRAASRRAVSSSG